MKMYKISEDELRRIFHDALAYEALDYGGVDNWSWYGESFMDFIDIYKKDYQIPDEEEFYFDDVVDHAFQELIKIHHKLEWRVVEDNPIKLMYDKFCAKYDGFVHRIHDATRNLKGQLVDSFIYEIITSKGE